MWLIGPLFDYTLAVLALGLFSCYLPVWPTARLSKCAGLRPY